MHQHARKTAFGPWTHLWGPMSIGPTRYALICLVGLGQAATVWITWPLWQTRVDPPHLPLFDLPAWPFGWLVLASLGVVLIAPRWGLAVHAAVLAIACLFDQMRTQPQFLALWILMLGCVSKTGTRICRWYLVTMWLWAGLHKLLSPDWWGHRSWSLVDSAGFDADQGYLAFAVVVAVGELALGIAACFRPRQAAWMCVAMHVGIIVYLSPWFADWNMSVIPWNAATAVVGGWVLWHSPPGLPRIAWERGLAAALTVLPAGFYLGWIDHGVAGVLYSDNLPRGLITRPDGVREIVGWGELRVPFPNERRLLRQHFARIAQPGDKLHIADPRPWLEDQYLVKPADGAPREITRDEFLSAGPGVAPGVARDNHRGVFAFSRAGARMLKRTPGSMIYAIEVPPAGYRPELLRWLVALPNVEQVQLAGCPVSDAELGLLDQLPRLRAIGLEGTNVSSQGLRRLRQRPGLVVLADDTARTADGRDANATVAEGELAN
jgi:hypothetical protein